MKADPRRRNRIMFRPAELWDAIFSRSLNETERWMSKTAQRDLARYYTLIGIGLEGLHLSQAEGMLLVSTISLFLLEGRSYENRAQQIARFTDAAALPFLVQQYALRTPDLWDTTAFLALVEQWSLLRRLAIFDAVERWQLLPPYLSEAERLLRVGLLSREATLHG